MRAAGFQRRDDRPVEGEHGVEDDDRDQRVEGHAAEDAARVHRPPPLALTLTRPTVTTSTVTMRDDEEQAGRRGRAVADIVVLDELLARIDRHRRRVLVVAGQHIDHVEDAQRVEAAEDHGDEQRRADERQRDLEEHLYGMHAVDPRRLVDLARQGLQGGQDQQRHEGRRLPDIDGDDGDHGERRIGEPGERPVDEADARAAWRS